MTARTIRRPNGAGSLRLRTDGRWEARVSVGYRRQKSFIAHTPEEAEARAQAFRVGMGAPLPPLRTPKRTRDGITAGQRFRVLERCAFACTYCGRRAPDVELTVDHVIPKSKGGTDDDENLTAACRDCNIGKRDRIVGGEGSQRPLGPTGPCRA